MIVQEAHRETRGIFSGERIGLQPDGFELAEAPPDRLRMHAEVNVRSIRFLADLEVLIDVIERVNGFGLRAGGLEFFHLIEFGGRKFDWRVKSNP